MLQVIVSEQDLSDIKIELGKQLFVGRHEPRLADRSTRLQFGEVDWPFVVAEHSHTSAHRAGSYQHDFLPGCSLRGELDDQLFGLREIELLVDVRQDTRPQLHHHATDVLEQSRTHAGSW